MGRRLSLHILLPIEGYEEDKVYDSEEISLRMAYSEQEPDNVYYRKLKEKSVYASFDDIVRFVCEKYSLGEIHNFSMYTDHWGNSVIQYEENKYVVKEAEIKQLEREHITKSVYCNEYRYCSLSWFYSSIGYELVPNDIAIVDDELIKKAASLIGYESDNDFANGLADVIENSSDGEDKFIASLVLAKEIARTLGGEERLLCLIENIYSRLTFSKKVRNFFCKFISSMIIDAA